MQKKRKREFTQNVHIKQTRLVFWILIHRACQCHMHAAWDTLTDTESQHNNNVDVTFEALSLFGCRPPLVNTHVYLSCDHI